MFTREVADVFLRSLGQPVAHSSKEWDVSKNMHMHKVLQEPEQPINIA